MDERRHLLDLIYRTVLEPGLWVTVMESMADSLGGSSGCLTRTSVENGEGTAVLARSDLFWLRQYQEYYGRLNLFVVAPRPRDYIGAWAPQVTTEFDYLPKDELIRHEYYNDFMLRAGAASHIMISLASADFDICALNIQRSDKREPFGREEKKFAQGLHPHLIRAFGLGEKFRDLFALGECQAAALNGMRDGVVIVDAKSRIRHANMAAEGLMGARNALDVVEGRLTATHPAAAWQLEALIGAAADPNSRRGGSIKLPFQGRDSLEITVAPLAADALSIFANGPAVLVTIADAQAGEDVVRLKLAELFALTSAEIRIALALFQGATPRGAAEMFDVSVSTVRSHMASIFAKTETAGQVELSRLMMRLASQS
jgi:DNA-binding CsgD family transcriptional regulator